ncbi:hypothetical protein K435DRAFT_814090 [Dendrothele bispora CBS 962.96]|uniref:Uncharacterized protein n=1 Tax=Dendrothele bispora (strain CBS 962.96) TaxID=1314807 RepID=A0A4S8KJT9_DENBC|nr:hypothetical protein K435DRAFT_814090 [Dendrothele bispora CBS 962.96]
MSFVVDKVLDWVVCCIARPIKESVQTYSDPSTFAHKRLLDYVKGEICDTVQLIDCVALASDNLKVLLDWGNIFLTKSLGGTTTAVLMHAHTIGGITTALVASTIRLLRLDVTIYSLAIGPMILAAGEQEISAIIENPSASSGKRIPVYVNEYESKKRHRMDD